MHGLAGSAAVALLVLTTIGNTAWSMLYLLVFGVGTIAGMMLITAGLAWPFVYAGTRFTGYPIGFGWRRASSAWSSVLSLRIASGWSTGCSASARGGRRDSAARMKAATWR